MYLIGFTDSVTFTIMVQCLQIVYYRLVPLEGTKMVSHIITELEEVEPNLLHPLRAVRRRQTEKHTITNNTDVKIIKAGCNQAYYISNNHYVYNVYITEIFKLH